MRICHHTVWFMPFFVLFITVSSWAGVHPLSDAQMRLVQAGYHNDDTCGDPVTCGQNASIGSGACSGNTLPLSGNADEEGAVCVSAGSLCSETEVVTGGSSESCVNGGDGSPNGCESGSGGACGTKTKSYCTTVVTDTGTKNLYDGNEMYQATCSCVSSPSTTFGSVNWCIED
jgi:hypothetical protein